MDRMRSYRVGNDTYVSVSDFQARIALAAAAIGVGLDTGKIGREEARGALTALLTIKQGLDAL